MPKTEGLEPKGLQYEPAPPDYGEEPPYMESEEKGLPPARGESIINKLIPIGVAVLISVLLVGFFFSPVKQSQYKADVTRLENDLVAMREVEKNLGNKITTLETANKENLNVINDAVSKATKDIETKATSVTQSLAGYVTKEELNNAKSDVVELKASFTSLQTSFNNITLPAETQAKLNTLASEIETLKTRLTQAENKLATQAAETVKPTAKIRYIDYTRSTDYTEATAYFDLTINNLSAAKELKSITISIESNSNNIYGIASTSIGSSFGSRSSTLFWNFENYKLSNINIDAGKDKVIELSMNITFTQAQPGSFIDFEPVVNVTDWEYR